MNRGPPKRSRRSYDGSSSTHPQRPSHGFLTPPKTSLEGCPLSPYTQHPTPSKLRNAVEMK
jgi:hypothetical protein